MLEIELENWFLVEDQFSQKIVMWLNKNKKWQKSNSLNSYEKDFECFKPLRKLN